MSGVGFEPTPTYVDQKPQNLLLASKILFDNLESGALDHSATLTYAPSLLHNANNSREKWEGLTCENSGVLPSPWSDVTIQTKIYCFLLSTILVLFLIINNTYTVI